MEIRIATPTDIDAIAAVLQAAFIAFEPLYTPGAFAATTPNSAQIAARWAEGPVWVAVPTTAVVGTVAAVIKPTGLYVRSMAVLPAARGQNVGRKLLAAVEAYALAHGCARLFLSTTPFLHQAIRLYERYGFQRTAAEPHELFGTPLFTLEKKLG